MSTIPAFQSAYIGIQSGLQSAASSSAKIAATGATIEELTTSLVTLNQAELQVTAAAKALQTSSDILGSLLDITV